MNDDIPENNNGADQPAEDGGSNEREEHEQHDLEQIQVLPLVALRDTVIFPEMIVPLQVGRDRSVKALYRAVRTSQPVALITQRSSDTEEVTSVD